MRFAPAHGKLTPVLVASLCLVIACLAGCTPGPDARVAIRNLGDGKAEILAMLCPGEKILILQLYESDEGNGAGWVITPPAAGNSPAAASQVVRITPFQVPQGWLTTERSLTALRPGIKYGIGVGRGPAHNSLTHFTVTKLEESGRDQVIAGSLDHVKVMSETKFMNDSGDQCGRQ